MTGPSQASDLVELRSPCAQRHGRTLKTASLSYLGHQANITKVEARWIRVATA